MRTVRLFSRFFIYIALSLAVTLCARAQSPELGADARRQPLSFDPDILVSDLAMPDQDGYDLLRVLHNDPKFSSLPAIALTGFATLHDREMALQAGFIAHLPKPVEFPVLLAVLDRVFEEKRR